MITLRLIASTTTRIALRQQQQQSINLTSRFHVVAASRTMSSTTTRQPLKSTPDLCDDYEETIRIIDPSIGLRNFGGKKHFGGYVVTVKCHEDNSLVKKLATTNGSGKVMVVDGGGSRRRALLGDQVAADCVQNGWEGLVINGSVRDVDELALLDLGVKAIGPHPMKTIKRDEGQIEIPVTFGGVTISQNDFIVCDNNGVVVNETPMID